MKDILEIKYRFDGFTGYTSIKDKPEDSIKRFLEDIILKRNIDVFINGKIKIEKKNKSILDKFIYKPFRNLPYIKKIYEIDYIDIHINNEGFIIFETVKQNK